MSVGSIYFNGNSQLLISANSNLTLTGDFTIEFYAKCSNTPVNPYAAFFRPNVYFVEGNYICSISLNNTFSGNFVTLFLDESGTILYRGNIIVANSLWHHVAIVRNGTSTNNVSVYVDGVLDGKSSNNTTWDFGTSGVIIGGKSDQVVSCYDGSFSNLRVVNGTALYTSNFTPSTTNLTAVPGTVLLLNTAFKNPFIDSSPNNIEITQNNSPTPQTDSPVSPIVCFKEDTKILIYRLNNELYVPIQHLKKGDLVKTLLNGFIPIQIIGCSKIYNSGDDTRIVERLYKCSKNNYPELFEDLIITGSHSILVDTITEDQYNQTIKLLGKIYATDDKYRLTAYIDERTEPYKLEGIFNIYHIALDNSNNLMNYGIYANGLLVESTSIKRLKELSAMVSIE